MPNNLSKLEPFELTVKVDDPQAVTKFSKPIANFLLKSPQLECLALSMSKIQFMGLAQSQETLH